MNKEVEIFERHAQGKGLKHSAKRDRILLKFLKAKRHLSAEDLFNLVKRDHPEIGFTTVYRTLKLIVDSGIAEVVDFDDGVRRFERKLGREHHAHFICTKCNKNFEVFSKEIRNLNIKLTKEKGFIAQNHRFEIFGLCNHCSNFKAGKKDFHG